MKINILFTFIIYLLSNQIHAKEIKIQLNQNNLDQMTFENLTKYNNMLSDVNKDRCLLYLKKYEEKDLKGISQMFSNDIILRDWKIRVEGKENALIETRKNFESVKTIKIEVLSIYENENTVAAELKIVIDNKDEIYVIDVVTINSDGKISSIKAYIGRGDE